MEEKKTNKLKKIVLGKSPKNSTTIHTNGLTSGTQRWKNRENCFFQFDSTENQNELTDQSPTTQDEIDLKILPPSGYDQSLSDALMWRGK